MPLFKVLMCDDEPSLPMAIRQLPHSVKVGLHRPRGPRAGTGDGRQGSGHGEGIVVGSARGGYFLPDGPRFERNAARRITVLTGSYDDHGVIRLPDDCGMS